MKQKRNYIKPEMYVEACLGRECWMLPSVSGGVDPGNAPARFAPVPDDGVKAF